MAVAGPPRSASLLQGSVGGSDGLGSCAFDLCNDSPRSGREALKAPRCGYTITPGFSKQVLVPGNIRNAFLDNLVPDTPYSISVSALYADGEGSPVSDTGKTRKCTMMAAKARGAPAWAWFPHWLPGVG